MTFPTTTIATENLDSATDDPSLARVDLLDAVEKLNTIISEAGSADGVAVLDGSGYLPTAQLPTTISTATLTLAPTTGVVNIQQVLRLTELNRSVILNFTANAIGDMAVCADIGGTADNPGIVFFKGNVWVGIPFSSNVFVSM